MAEKNMEFKAEIRQLLDLMIHSIYSNKEIFLRELAANAADAIDKARFESLTHPEQARDWEIRIDADEKAGTLTVSDNGIGMTGDELAENLGTIAHSGTKAFVEHLKKSDDKAGAPELIGQFGVGFYSAFMAADKVEVTSRKFGSDKAFCWTSTGKDTFTVTEARKDGVGTDIKMYLKDDFKQFLDYWQVSSVIRKYSDFIEYPIRMRRTTKDKDGKETVEDNTINTMKAIWLRKESEVTEEEYKSFYNHVSQDYGDPARRIVFNAEGAAEFKSLLFLKGHRPFDFQFGMKPKNNVQLYVRRVFITDDCPGLLPEYMTFAAGVVDSSDLPLNISRETLQDNPMISRINKSLSKRIISELGKMMKDERSKYEDFYREFSRSIKEGVHSDYANKEKLQDLLLFETMNSPEGKLVSLKEYSDAMPATQKAIYYICGESRAALQNSPQLEMLRKQKCDVIFLLDPIDEFVFSDIQKYAEKDVRSVSRGDVAFDETVQKEIEEKTKKAGEENKDLVEYLKKTLGDKVKDVRFSARLTESPCCLVSDTADPTLNMQKILKAINKDAPDLKRILEINADNALIKSMKSLLVRTPDSQKLKEFAELLYDQAVVGEGGEVADPVEFSRRMVSLMTEAVKLELGDK